MARNRVEFFVRARDQASATLKKVEGSLKGLLGTQRLFPAFLGAVGLGGIASAFDRIVERGQQVSGVQNAFRRSTEGNVEAIGQLRSAAQGLIRDYDLMVGFNRSIALGSARNTEEYADLIRAGIQLGRTQGVDALSAVESLTLGLGRQSAAILDNVGLTVRAEDAYKRHAQSLGVNVSQLDATQRRTAFLNAAFEQIESRLSDQEDSVAVTADAWQRMETSIGNAVDQWQRFVAESPAIAKAVDVVRRFLFGTSTLERLSKTEFRGEGLLPSPQTFEEGAQNLRTISRLIQETQERAAGAPEGQSDYFKRLARDLSEARDEAREFIRTFEEALALGPDAPEPPAPPPPPGRPPPARSLAGFNGQLSGGFQLIPRLQDIITEGLANSILREAGFETGTSRRSTFFEAGIFRQDRDVRQLTPIQQPERPDLAAATIQAINQLRERGQATQEVMELAQTQLEALGYTTEAAANAVGLLTDETDGLAEAGQYAIASLGSTVAAVVSGVDDIGVAFSSLTTSILQTIAQRESSSLNLGGFGVPIIGAIGGIIGAAFRSGPDRPVPVRVDEFGESARSDLEGRRSGPDNVTLQFISSTTGELVEEVLVQLGGRTRSDRVLRIPSSIVVGGA